MRTLLSRLLDVVFRHSREQRMNDEIQALALVAAVLPARRASRLDPVSALRRD